MWTKILETNGTGGCNIFLINELFLIILIKCLMRNYTRIIYLVINKYYMILKKKRELVQKS